MAIPLFAPIKVDRHNQLYMYTYAAVLQLLSMYCCLRAARRIPEERIRWVLVTLALATQAVDYALAALINCTDLGQGHPLRIAWAMNMLTGAGKLLWLLSLIRIRGDRTKLVRGLDTFLVVLMFLLFSFALGSGRGVWSGSVRVSVAAGGDLLKLLAALVIATASDRRSSRHFSRAMVCYNLVDFSVAVLVNLMNDQWLNNTWPVMSDLMLCLPNILLCEWASRPLPEQEPRSVGRLEFALVESLQPSLMAMGSVVLALFGLRKYPLLAGAIVTLTVFCYVLRTQLFYFRIFRERRELRKEASHMHQLATIDPLTGVGNRRWLEEASSHLLGRKNTFPCTLLLIDLDHFKTINDTFGHQSGDEFLKLVGHSLQQLVLGSSGACCARIGGDEFAVLLPRTESAVALQLAEGLRKQVADASFSVLVRGTLSIGVAVSREPVALTALLRAADEALYRTKACGRNGVQLTLLGAGLVAQEMAQAATEAHVLEATAGPTQSTNPGSPYL
ncbi:MAG: GGDEF domain-containing protein [Acidobacteriaceae bacterium]|nr:GGDEF domain-containing protein [Acidobacteriaceae bacterium]